MAQLVADAMVTRPVVHGPDANLADLRAFFDDDHVHMALLVDADRLTGVVERADLRRSFPDDTPAGAIAQLEGRTIRPDAPLADVFAAMRSSGRRRLAVTTGDSLLVGLLCLKRSGLGFCRDDDVSSRRLERPSDAHGRPSPAPRRRGADTRA